MPLCFRCRGQPGVLALCGAKCPALREVDLQDFDVDQPPEPLAALTVLSLEDCSIEEDDTAPLSSLVLAAPQLKTLCWAGYHDDGVAEAAAGHPRLGKLCVEFEHLGPHDRAEEAWLSAARQLPALTSMLFQVRGESFDCDELEGDAAAGRTARVLRLCEWLGHCTKLQDLYLSDAAGAPAHEVLAALGAALGGRLHALTLACTTMPARLGAAGRTLYTLAALFPRLRELTLELDRPEGMKPEAMPIYARVLLGTACELPPLCPLLEKVKLLWFTSDGVERGAWRRAGGADGADSD